MRIFDLTTFPSAVQPTLASLNTACFPSHCQSPAFELLGFDILIDQNMKVYAYIIAYIIDVDYLLRSYMHTYIYVMLVGLRK